MFNLPPAAIWAIIAVFGGSFLLMIPIAISQSKRKKKAAEYSKNNSDKAILHIYGSSPVIDNQKIRDMNYQKGTDLQYIIALSPGSHCIEAKYSASEPSLGKNVNYQTPKISSTIMFEAGHEYNIAIYFYSPEERYSYYNGDVGECVYSEELAVESSRIGSNNRAYIICYKET
jgi:hypothetical protein